MESSTIPPGDMALCGALPDRRSVRWFAALILLAQGASAWAQAPPDFADAVRAAMSPSLEKQRAAIQKQAAAAMHRTATPAEGFFSVPFPDPAPVLAAAPACDPLPGAELNALIEENSKREGVLPDLIRAVIGKESGNRPCAVSVKGAQGLMQLMPEVVEQFGVSNPFDPKENVGAGAKLLKMLLSKYNGDVSLALSAYNAGAARVDRAGGIPAIPETLNYVSDILTKLPKQ